MDKETWKRLTWTEIKVRTLIFFMVQNYRLIRHSYFDHGQLSHTLMSVENSFIDEFVLLDMLLRLPLYKYGYQNYVNFLW